MSLHAAVEGGRGLAAGDPGRQRDYPGHRRPRILKWTSTEEAEEADFCLRKLPGSYRKKPSDFPPPGQFPG